MIAMLYGTVVFYLVIFVLPKKLSETVGIPLFGVSAYVMHSLMGISVEFIIGGLAGTLSCVELRRQNRTNIEVLLYLFLFLAVTVMADVIISKMLCREARATPIAVAAARYFPTDDGKGDETYVKGARVCLVLYCSPLNKAVIFGVERLPRIGV